MTKEIKTAIVLIDIQGKLAEIMPNSDQLLKSLEVLIKGAQLLEIPIIWTEQLPDKLGATTKLLRDLLHDQKPIKKAEYSCARNADFLKYINNEKFNHFFVCGIETHVCVYQTTKDLLYLGHDVEIIVDAVSSRTELNKNIGIEKMKSLGAKLTNIEMLLFEKQEVALGDKFRQLIKLIK